MQSHSGLARLISLTLFLGLVWSCAGPQVVQSPAGPYFVTPEITYLRDTPNYGGNIVGTLYRGDKLDLLNNNDTWWLVKLQRTGETGYVRKELLSLTPIRSVFYYVKKDTLPLLESPSSDSMALMLLFRGDKLKKVEESADGWWRVLAIKGRSLGWVPASALTENRKEALKQQPRKSYYYVAIRKLILRGQPSAHGEVVRTLRFNDQIQKLAESKDWFKVRQPATGAVGWVISRDLTTLPSFSPRGLRASKQLRPFNQRKEPLSEPEFM
jgi:uncharacterized protein YgiM (DUF1202 family)